MEIASDFVVGVPVDEAWKILTDVELIAPCMPGAQLTEIDGDNFAGKVKVKVGPVTAQYTGKAEWLELDAENYRAVLKADGRDTRGQGNASAEVVMQLVADGDDTAVSVVTELKVTGKVAQFGRGIMADVSAKLLEKFVECLETKIVLDDQTSDVDNANRDDSTKSSPVAEGPRKVDMAEPEAINLIDAAGVPMAKRIVPLAAGFLLLWMLVRRRKKTT